MKNDKLCVNMLPPKEENSIYKKSPGKNSKNL